MQEYNLSYSFKRTYTSDDFRFLGHFPKNSIFPGVYLLDEVLSYLRKRYVWDNYSILQARFIDKVVPNMSLVFNLSLNINEKTLNLIANVFSDMNKIAMFKILLYKKNI
ncbi:hypothetical protein EV693_102118 [Nicoletella semolina]|uniref:ApeI dehydratase-like domain-containing protein n=1 Tax=Nicoletella semolina TaxID=271160 RepID=A0A4R2NBB1_9PAST|nr:hypothetical protein [Nicoletella semolina]MDH2924897.1 hypothetical protein [Nicoletella semolina]TCP18439.1 hypothetical protein EV693_102118 [Nicoletella semolina]